MAKPKPESGRACDIGVRQLASVPFKLVVDTLFADAQNPCGHRLVSVGRIQSLQDRKILNFGQSLSSKLCLMMLIGRRCKLRLQFQICIANYIACRKRSRPLQNVFQFSDVASPRVTFQSCQSLKIE